MSRGEWSEREGLDSASCVPSISHLDLHSCFRFNSAAMASYNAGKFVFYELFFFSVVSFVSVKRHFSCILRFSEGLSLQKQKNKAI